MIWTALLALSLSDVGYTLAVAAETDTRSVATREMVDYLSEVNERIDFIGNPYENKLRADYYRDKLLQATSPAESLRFSRLHADELLKAGESRSAVEAFERVMELEALQNAPESDRLDTRLLLGTAWLRIGEQENCLAHHTTESCLFPIDGSGVHQLPEGSEHAVEVFRGILREDASNLGARWLLNIGEMTLGRYPDAVPSALRIPEASVDSEHDIGRFVDVAADLGLDNDDTAGGTVLDDFNNDGHVDIMVSGIRRDSQLKYFQNRGDGSFDDRTRQAGLEGLVRGLNLVQGDYDNDGRVDVLVLRGAWMGRTGRILNSLLRNNGDGTFSDVTLEAGLTTARPTQAAVFVDYDSDGWLDLCIGNESSAADRHRVELFRNNGDGTFTECGFRSGLVIFEYVKGVASGDYNNDGRPDLYFSIFDAPNRLYRNDGEDPETGAWRFTDVSDTTDIAGPSRSFPCWFFDYDNDGFEDIFAASYDLTEFDESVAEHLGLRSDGARMTLYRNRGDGSFEDVSQSMNVNHALLAMGANYGDLDNDGWLDLYIGTGNPDFRALFPNKMYRNNEGRGFQDVTSSGGFGHLQKGHAIAFADLDNDGDQDVYANMGGAYFGDIYRNALFENPGHQNHWLKLKLVGRQSNRSAIGARIQVTLRVDGEPVQIHRTVRSGGSFGANPLQQEIGLGSAVYVESVTVQWPFGDLVQTFRNLQADQAYRIEEGEASPEPVTREPAAFAREKSPMHHH